MNKITIKTPDDWHLHLRDDHALSTTVPASARCFARAIVMPNLQPPITDLHHAEMYFKRIQAQIPPGKAFQALMTLYLTDITSPEFIKQAKQSGLIHGCKLYPAGATTHSDHGVTNIRKIYNTLATMEKEQLPLLIHGEVTDDHIDIFDREAVFIETILQPLIKDFPELPIVLEHITTADAVDFVQSQSDKLAATITVHHLAYNRNQMLAAGIRPHYYCLPILKRERHQQALLTAATSGNAKFFLGTDSAPHTVSSKQSACGCAGIFSAPVAIELCTEIFEQQNALDKLENFTSVYGAQFYKMPVNKTCITLEKSPWRVPEYYQLGDEQVIPLCAGEQLAWRMSND